MSKDLGNVEYDDDAALYAGVAFENTQNTDEVMKPEIMLIDMKDEDLSRIIEDEDGDKVKLEALMIANRIKGFMENGFVTDKRIISPEMPDIRISLFYQEVLQHGVIQWQMY